MTSKDRWLDVTLVLSVENLVDFWPTVSVYEGRGCMPLTHSWYLALDLPGWHFEVGLNLGGLHDWLPVVLIFLLDNGIAFCGVSEGRYAVSWLKLQLAIRSWLVCPFLCFHRQLEDILHLERSLLHSSHISIDQFLSVGVAYCCLGPVLLEGHLLVGGGSLESISSFLVVNGEVMAVLGGLLLPRVFRSVETLSIGCVEPALVVHRY